MTQTTSENGCGAHCWTHLGLKLRGFEDLDGPYLPIKFEVHLLKFSGVPKFQGLLFLSFSKFDKSFTFKISKAAKKKKKKEQTRVDDPQCQKVASDMPCGYSNSSGIFLAIVSFLYIFFLKVFSNADQFISVEADQEN